MVKKENNSEEYIRQTVRMFTDSREENGFEVYVVTKSSPRLKKMSFYRKGDSLKGKIENSILDILVAKYLAEEAVYVSADYMADNQNKFYIIDTNEGYNPFSFLVAASVPFEKNNIKDATGFVFCITNNNKKIWAYQHLWPIMVPNKSKKNWIARIITDSESDVFEELLEPIITIAERIDLLIIDDYIVASDFNILQKNFGFQDYIRSRVEKVIEKINEKNIVTNVEILKNYVQRGNGKTKYAKKLMHIADSSVLKMDSVSLWENIHRSERWNERVKEENGLLVLEHYTDVENLIDLLDERYTRSDITNTEYDTAVKQIAAPPILSEDSIKGSE